MDKIEKALQKLTDKERIWVKDILERLSLKKIRGLDIKKLKGRQDIFRVRKGNIRILYRLTADNKLYVLAIERRSERTSVSKLLSLMKIACIITQLIPDQMYYGLA